MDKTRKRDLDLMSFVWYNRDNFIPTPNGMKALLGLFNKGYKRRLDG